MGSAPTSHEKLRSTASLFEAERPLSANSDEQAAREDDALLGIRSFRATNGKAQYWKDLILLTWAVLATTAVLILALLYQHQTTRDGEPKRHTGKRNLIFMVSDGMGPASLSLTRSFRQYTEGNLSSSQSASEGAYR